MITTVLRNIFVGFISFVGVISVFVLPSAIVIGALALIDNGHIHIVIAMFVSVFLYIFYKIGENC